MARSGLAAVVAALAFAALFGSGARGDVTGAGQAPRLLYASDWSGTSQIYALDPSGHAVPGQIAAGFDPQPSRDGRSVLLSSCGASGASLFVARADGGRRRRLARSGRSCFFAYLSAAWAPDSRRIAYTIDQHVHVVNADGTGDRVVSPTRDQVGFRSELAWSADGRSLAFLASKDSLDVLSNGSLHRIAPAGDFSWSPVGAWIAFNRQDSLGRTELDLVRPDGSGLRRVAAGYYGFGLDWSADGRFIAFWSTAGIGVVEPGRDGVRYLPGYDSLVGWAPRGHAFAAVRTEGLSLFDLDSGRGRLLSADRPLKAAWSPDGHSLAYVSLAATPGYESGDLRVVSVAGDVRTVVAAAGDHGGAFSGLIWTRPAAGVRYRPAAGRSVAKVSQGQLVARWTITRLAADGGRVAYVSCGHVFIWAPATGVVAQAEPVASLSPRCTIGDSYDPFEIYSLALAGDRVAFGGREGNMGQSWYLYAGGVGASSPFVALGGVNSANGCAVGPGGLGDLAGSGDLLVYSTWSDNGRCPAVTLAQQIHRVEPGGCPCPVVASDGGPLVPFDVDGGRIVDGGSNATEIRDRAGALLLSVPVSPLAAQLSGGDLVVLVQGALRDYDASTGALLHAWPVADVPGGGECGSPHRPTWACRNPQLVLMDAARGLVTYVLDGQVHLLRLANGVDAIVGAGTLSRFTDAGLVSASGDHLSYVPDGQLPR